jgi:hypothetical protein
VATFDGGNLAGFNNLVGNGPGGPCDPARSTPGVKTWTPTLHVGGAFTVGYQGAAPNVSGLATLGTVGAGQSWNGVRLPVSLTAAGAPGCWWSVGSILWLPFATDAMGTGVFPAVPIPLDHTLVDATFFEQSLLLIPQANPLGLLPIFSNQWRIGSGLQPAVDSVFNFQDNPPSPVGQQWLRAQAPVVRFVF